MRVQIRGSGGRHRRAGARSSPLVGRTIRMRDARQPPRVHVRRVAADMAVADERRGRGNEFDREREQDDEHRARVERQEPSQRREGHARPSRRLSRSECQNDRPMSAAPTRPVTTSGIGVTASTNMMTPSAMIA